jgi:hypothetical protein
MTTEDLVACGAIFMLGISILMGWFIIKTAMFSSNEKESKSLSVYPKVAK